MWGGGKDYGGKGGGWGMGGGYGKGDAWGMDPWGMPMGKGGGWGMPMMDPWSYWGAPAWDPWSMKGCGKCMGGKGKDAGKKGGDAGPPKEANPNKVFVGALPPQPNEGAIRAFFETFGEIQEIIMMAHDNGISKGYCFVTFVSHESALAAIANGEANIIDDKWVDVKSSEGKSGSTQKPGDWWCPQCGDLVFASKSSCRMCGFDGAYKGKGKGKDKGKSGKTQRAGDWSCPSCGDLVFASRNACKMCQTPKPDNPASPY